MHMAPPHVHHARLIAEARRHHMYWAMHSRKGKDSVVWWCPCVRTICQAKVHSGFDADMLNGDEWHVCARSIASPPQWLGTYTRTACCALAHPSGNSYIIHLDPPTRACQTARRLHGLADFESRHSPYSTGKRLHHTTRAGRTLRLNLRPAVGHIRGQAGAVSVCCTSVPTSFRMYVCI